MNQDGAGKSQAMVASSQPLAVQAAFDVLEAGGNAVDAAVCAAAVLGVVEPMSTGIGGDCFAIVYEAKTGKIHGLNGSGRAPKAARIEDVLAAGYRAMPAKGIWSVSVPGALHAWQSLLERLGTKPLGDVLQPAVVAARDGFKVTPIIARDWANQQSELENGVNTHVYLPGGRTPRVDECFKQPELARSLELIADQGIQAFYDGPITQAIVAQSQRLDGWLSSDDFETHTSTWVDPISSDYRGHTVYQIPPNGQGIVTLETLNLLEAFPLKDMDAAERLHVQIEATKLAFADAWQYVADPEWVDVPVSGLLSPSYTEERRALINDRALQNPAHGFPSSDTIYVTVVDQEGNAASLINSIFMHFGSKVVAENTGIILQNRAALCSLDPQHPNALAPHKRLYHTIIPPLVFKGGKPWLSFGVVGGYMQPQAQVQILTNLIDLGMDLKEAIDAPRYRWIEENKVTLEAFPDDVTQNLSKRGHQLIPVEGHGGFGGAQAILIDQESGVLTGASDPRKDGCVMKL